VTSLINKTKGTDESDDILISLWIEKKTCFHVGNKMYSNRNEKRRAIEKMAEKLCYKAHAIVKNVVYV
jgi:hypothetical protein